MSRKGGEARKGRDSKRCACAQAALVTAGRGEVLKELRPPVCQALEVQLEVTGTGLESGPESHHIDRAVMFGRILLVVGISRTLVRRSSAFDCD